MWAWFHGHAHFRGSCVCVILQRQLAGLLSLIMCKYMTLPSLPVTTPSYQSTGECQHIQFINIAQIPKLWRLKDMMITVPNTSPYGDPFRAPCCVQFVQQRPRATCPSAVEQAAAATASSPLGTHPQYRGMHDAIPTTMLWHTSCGCCRFLVWLVRGYLSENSSTPLMHLLVWFWVLSCYFLIFYFH